MEKQTVEGYNGIQRDFGVKGSIDEKPFILAPEIIASLPGGEGISGDEIGIEGARDIGPGGEAISGGTFEIEKDLGCLEEQWIGGGSSNIDKGVGDV